MTACATPRVIPPSAAEPSHPVSDDADSDNLLVRTRAGNPEAFGEFYDHQAPALLRWFSRRTAAGDVAAELTAETFAEALASLDGYRPDSGPPAAWLYGIAHNQFRHWLRSKRVRDSARSALGLHVQLPTEDDIEMVEIRADIQAVSGELGRAWVGLSEGVREAITERVVEGRSYAEVAEHLGCSEGAARVRVSRGLSQLLEELNREGVHDV